MLQKDAIVLGNQKRKQGTILQLRALRGVPSVVLFGHFIAPGDSSGPVARQRSYLVVGQTAAPV